MGKRLVMEIVDAEVFSEGQKLPRRRKARSFAEPGNSEIDRQHGQVGRQDSERAAQIEVWKRWPRILEVRTQKLRPDQISAQHKEQVNTHPAGSCKMAEP